MFTVWNIVQQLLFCMYIWASFQWIFKREFLYMEKYRAVLTAPLILPPYSLNQTLWIGSQEIQFLNVTTFAVCLIEFESVGN